MAVAETDLSRIRRFCEQQVPPEMRDQVRVEHRVRGRTVTSSSIARRGVRR